MDFVELLGTDLVRVSGGNAEGGGGQFDFSSESALRHKLEEAAKLPAKEPGKQYFENSPASSPGHGPAHQPHRQLEPPVHIRPWRPPGPQLRPAPIRSDRRLKRRIRAL